MALTPSEFHRLAVHLPGGDRLTTTARSASARLPDGRAWTITLGPERHRRIALLALPTCDVEIRLDGHTAEQAEAFHQRFFKVFQKGGG